MSDQSSRQTDEKWEEKEQEKVTEKSTDEKSWDEKSRRDPLSAMLWAGILIWAGVAFLIANLGLLRSMGLPASFDGWSLAVAGAGVILLAGVVIRLVVPEYSAPVAGQVILGMIFLAVGLDDVYGWEIIGPVAIIAVGLVVLLRAVRRNA
ncbi:MAG: hypothetical protein PVI04_08245 [Anaerolineales bacterium]|jgi:hypothetical protein